MKDPVQPVPGVDVSLRMTSRTVGTPMAAVLPDGADAGAALAQFAAGARVIEMGDAPSALAASIALDLARDTFPEERSFNAFQLGVRVPGDRTNAEPILDEVSASANVRWSLAAKLSPGEQNRLSTTRPLAMVTLPTPLDEAGEALARAIFQDWGDDLVIALPSSAEPGVVAPALDRLRAIAETAGCTLCIRVTASAPATLLAALTTSVASGMPVWLDGVSDAPAAIARGASLVSGADTRAMWDAFAARARAIGARRTDDLVLFGVEPDAAMRAAAELQYGKDTWLVSPVKNAALALKRLTEARGGALDTPLAREALANPPKECCLYQAEEPDLKEAATDWTYGLWVRETRRRRLPVG